MLSFSKIWKKEDRSYKSEYSDSFILMIILFKWGSFGWGDSLNVMGIKGGVNVFRIRMSLKTLKTQRVPVYFGSQYLTKHHELLQKSVFHKGIGSFKFSFS